jgi:hypothetical protein
MKGAYTWFDHRVEVGLDRAVGVRCLAVAIAALRRLVALFELSRCNRRAMALTDNVVSRRSRTAIASFSGSLLRRLARSASAHWRRLSSAAMMRSALAWAVSGEDYQLTPWLTFDTGPAMFGEPQSPILPQPRCAQKWAAQDSKFLLVPYLCVARQMRV